MALVGGVGRRVGPSWDLVTKVTNRVTVVIST